MSSESTAEVKEQAIPDDLMKLWHDCQMLATAFNLLHKGQYPFQWFRAVEGACKYIADAHAASVELAMKHPSASLIPELKAEIEKASANEEAKS